MHVSLRIIIPAVGIQVPGAAAGRRGPIHPLRVQIGYQAAPEVDQSLVFGFIQFRILLPDALIVIVDPLIVSAP